MRINELIKPSELSQFRQNPGDTNGPFGGTWHKTVSELMAKHGFQRAGKGSFGSVFLHPQKPYALKVFRNDPQYTKWVGFCNAHRGNPYLPVFKGNPIKVMDGVYSLRMEILKDGGTDMPAHILSSFVAFYKEIFLDQVDNSHSQDNVRFVKQMAPERFFPNYLDDENLKTVLAFLHQNQDNADIRHENVMRRGTQFVITDPLAPYRNV